MVVVARAASGTASSACTAAHYCSGRATHATMCPCNTSGRGGVCSLCAHGSPKLMLASTLMILSGGEGTALSLHRRHRPCLAVYPAVPPGPRPGAGQQQRGPDAARARAGGLPWACRASAATPDVTFRPECSPRTPLPRPQTPPGLPHIIIHASHASSSSWRVATAQCACMAAAANIPAGRPPERLTVDAQHWPVPILMMCVTRGARAQCSQLCLTCISTIVCGHQGRVS